MLGWEGQFKFDSGGGGGDFDNFGKGSEGGLGGKTPRGEGRDWVVH